MIFKLLYHSTVITYTQEAARDHNGDGCPIALGAVHRHIRQQGIADTDDTKHPRKIRNVDRNQHRLDHNTSQIKGQFGVSLTEFPGARGVSLIHHTLCGMIISPMLICSKGWCGGSDIRQSGQSSL